MSDTPPEGVGWGHSANSYQGESQGGIAQPLCIGRDRNLGGGGGGGGIQLGSIAQSFLGSGGCENLQQPFVLSFKCIIIMKTKQFWVHWS